MSDDRINLLLVDDEVQFLEATRKRLEARGFNVVAVDRGEKALAAARMHPIDIALVDLRMPGINGEETLEALKCQHEWMEVVILTGHGSVESAVECLRKGAYSYLQKPCSLEQLLEALQAAYQRRVMNKKAIDEKRMLQLLRSAQTDSPLGILRRLKELDREP